MTIKQFGGVFGRNPTFNNATIDGTLTVDQIVEKTGAAGIALDGVTLKDGNVVLAAGKGIDFSATSGTGTSELFDDYEEGTFTPAFAAASGAFTTLTYSLQHGNYTKIGNTVRAELGLATSNVVVGTASGELSITGLPYAHSSTFNTGASGFIGYMVRFGTAFSQVKPFVQNTATAIRLSLNATNDSGNFTLPQVSDLTTGATTFRNYITMTVVYKTA